MTSVQNPKIKAVFFDIDGTIFSLKTKSIPESTRKAIKNLRKKGIMVIVATGRSINDLDHIKRIDFDGFMTFNGGCCMTVDGHVMYRKLIDPNDIKNLIDYSVKYDVSFSLMYLKRWLSGMGKWYFYAKVCKNNCCYGECRR